ncbi:MAG: DUF547 domain-containing protein [Deferrisomatales bacterium]|nr:DUF547 domain-containing protein [Deferrisomatales bacterium]
MSRLFADAVQKAQAVLDANWTGRSTKPAPGLYPHQWNWDSGFIAIGRSHDDTAKAIREIDSLFAAQWTNGMVPQIVFDPGALGHYFPEPDFWQAERSPHAPRGFLTSGITMPPVNAIAAEAIHRNAGRRARRRVVLPFLERIYPKLLALHEYLYRERDPEGEGLVYIRHPWESGVDNSPTWDGPLRRMRIDAKDLPPYERRDLSHGVDPSMRPSDDDYDRYVFLVDLFRRLAYDEAAIRAACPFLVQDPLFNSVLARADEALAEIARLLGEPADQMEEWAAKSKEAIRTKLWHPEHRIFDAWDLAAAAPIEVDTAAGFLPLYAGAASREQAQALYERLDSASFCALHQGNCFTVPNYDTRSEGFARDNYWRGPVWININWMLAQGLRRYGYTLKADSLQKDLLQLPIRFGFYEYFDSFDGRGYGSRDFSWTAALFIDLVEASYSGEDAGPGLGKRLQALASPVRELNDGAELPDVPPGELAGELMRCVRALREAFYDTARGRVDYDRLRDSGEYRRYRVLTNGLRSFDLRLLVGRREKLAFWVNLYNTIVVDAVVLLGVKQSVKEVPELFRRVGYRIGEHRFTPDDMEHGILRANARPPFRPLRPFGARDPRKAFAVSPVDPRIHFALVCGSRSCAPIASYDGGRIGEQLEAAARSFVNSSEVLAVPEERRLLLSEIFRWYAEDFGGRVGILDFLHDYLADETGRRFLRENAGSLKIEYLDYDWNLNR